MAGVVVDGLDSTMTAHSLLLLRGMLFGSDYSILEQIVLGWHSVLQLGQVKRDRVRIEKAGDVKRVPI